MIILEIWKYGPVIEDMQIIFQGNNNAIRIYVTSTYYFKRLMTKLSSYKKKGGFTKLYFTNTISIPAHRDKYTSIR